MFTVAWRLHPLSFLKLLKSIRLWYDAVYIKLAGILNMLFNLKILTIFIPLILISCGKDNSAINRCYSREEALNYCVATRIAQTYETVYMAGLYCKPKYQVEFCYRLGGV